MSIRCKYCCEKCGYEASVGGGLERHMTFITHTILCQDCRALSDVRIKQDNINTWFDVEINVDELICPLCKGNDIELWGKNRASPNKFIYKDGEMSEIGNFRCPKCNEVMKKIDLNKIWE